MSDDILLNLNDFKSIEITANFQNSTSGWKMAKGDVCRMLEYDEASFSLEGPKKSCAQGHLLLVKCTVVNPEKPKPIIFEFVGRVTSTTDAEENLMRIDLAMQQYDSNTWLEIRNLLGIRQKEIFKFLRDVKGMD